MKGIELAEYFHQDLFSNSLSAKTKDEAIKEMLDMFVQNGYIRNADPVLQMLRQRESLGSTGLGNGIAIPHGRTTAAPDVLIAFGKSEAGIEFDSMDGKPVHLVFMIIAPPHEVGNLYLPILGGLVTVLKEGKSRKKLLKCNGFEEFITVIKGESVNDK